MSEQPSPTSPTEATEKAEFGGRHLLIGFVIGAVLQFGWWALIDHLQLQSVNPSNSSFFEHFLAMIRQSHTAGFLLGAVWGAMSNVANAPIRLVIWKALRWAIGFSLAYVGLDAIQAMLQIALGESLADIVMSAIWVGLLSAFAGLMLEVQRTVAPGLGSAPLSLRQFARWVLALNRSSVARVLVAALFGALIGITIEMLFQRSNAWSLMLVLDAIVAAVAIRMWQPSRQTLKKLAVGTWAVIIIVGLVLLVGVSPQLAVVAGIIVLVGYAILQSRKG